MKENKMKEHIDGTIKHLQNNKDDITDFVVLTKVGEDLYVNFYGSDVSIIGLCEMGKELSKRNIDRLLESAREADTGRQT